jgi:hypothetical protein
VRDGEELRRQHHVAIFAAFAVSNQDRVTLAVDIRQSQANDAINELNALARSKWVDKEVTVRVHLAGGLPHVRGIGFNCNKSCCSWS